MPLNGEKLHDYLAASLALQAGVRARLEYETQRTMWSSQSFTVRLVEGLASRSSSSR